MKNPYVHSNYDRIEDDNYQTIDNRCTYGFLEHFQPAGLSIDVCSPDGSGIINTLLECNFRAVGISDAFQNNVICEWIVTNPPYKRKLVDEIINRQISRIENKEVFGLACLLRNNFDCAKNRVSMFRDNEFYFGKIQLLFRPWWSLERKAQPIHNYVWHIWTSNIVESPKIMYSLGNKSAENENKAGQLKLFEKE